LNIFLNFVAKIQSYNLHNFNLFLKFAKEKFQFSLWNRRAGGIKDISVKNNKNLIIQCEVPHVETKKYRLETSIFADHFKGKRKNKHDTMRFKFRK
jgi:hypothetical protein